MDKILDYYVVFVWEQRRLIGYGLAKNTHKTYLSRAKNFRDFLRASKQINVRPEQINIRFIRSFEIYLRATKKHCNDYVMRNVQMLKRMLELCIDDGIISINPAKKFKFKYDRKKRMNFLNLEQLTLLKSCNILSPDLERTRDMFLFCCYTSITYCEVRDFQKKHVVKEGGQAWVKLIRQKTTTDETILVPLLQGAEEILQKYGYTLPVSCNSRMNKNLKKISIIAKIGIELETNSGRKTFGNVLVNDFGVDIKTVSVMMGHSSVETTERWYVQVQTKKIKRDMREAMSISW